MFIALLSFRISIARKCVSLNDEPSMIRPTLVDLSPFDFKYYPLMIILDKFNRSCNVFSPKIYGPKETKHIISKHLIW